MKVTQRWEYSLKSHKRSYWCSGMFLLLFLGGEYCNSLFGPGKEIVRSKCFFCAAVYIGVSYQVLLLTLFEGSFEQWGFQGWGSKYAGPLLKDKFQSSECLIMILRIVSPKLWFGTGRSVTSRFLSGSSHSRGLQKGTMLCIVTKRAVSVCYAC